MPKIKVKKLNDDATLPTKSNADDAGWDISSVEKVTIYPFTSAKIRTGISIEIPEGHELQIRGKSGLALHENLSISQGIGTIDSGFRGEVCVLLQNGGFVTRDIEKGQMIAQAILKPIVETEWEEVEELSQTSRGEKGFGESSTHKK